MFRDDVKFLVIDGHEVSPSTYPAGAYAHLVLSGLVGAALVLVWFRTRSVRWS